MHERQPSGGAALVAERLDAPRVGFLLPIRSACFNSFFKSWSPTTTIFFKDVGTLQDAVAIFQKVHTIGADFFVKINEVVGLTTTLETDSEGGVQIGVEETSLII